MSDIVDDFFLKLPEELSGALLMEWLPVRALMAIDSAYCNVLKRPVLLNSVFSSSVCLCRMMPAKCLLNDFMNWVCIRGIRRNELVLGGETNLKIFEAYVSRLGEHVKRVKMEDVDDLGFISSELISVTAMCCHKLVSLTISQCFVSESILDVLFYCSHLQELRILNCDEVSSSTLDLNNLNNTTYSRLKKAVLHCTESTWLAEAVLQVNDPASLQCLSVRCDEFPVIHLLQKQLTHSARLCSLGLPRSRALTDCLLMEIITACPSVRHLDLSGCMELTDVSGIAVSQHLPHLTTLNISYCLFTDALLASLVEHCNNTLTGLFAHSCGNITGEGLNQLLQNCPHLRTFGFSCCDMYAPNLDIPQMHALTTLVLDEILPEDEEDLFVDITEHCQQLQHLRLSFEEGYEHFNFTLFSAENLPQLQSLVVYYPNTRYQHVQPTVISTPANNNTTLNNNPHPIITPVNINAEENSNPGTAAQVNNATNHNNNPTNPNNHHNITATPDANDATNPNTTTNTSTNTPTTNNNTTTTSNHSTKPKRVERDVTTQQLRALQTARPTLIVSHGLEAFEYNILNIDNLEDK